MQLKPQNSVSLLPYQEILESILAVVSEERHIFLVGGAVRDILLGRTTKDLDFVVSQGAVGTARSVANELRGAFYILDSERDTARVVLFKSGNERLHLDFARFRGADLENDLKGRDFTLNAIAINLRSNQELIDPLHGASDLRSGLIRACSTTSFQDDPLRILRALRLAVDFNYQIEKTTIKMMVEKKDLISRVSSERIRDELFRMMEGTSPAASIKVMDRLGVLTSILPELNELKGIKQSLPHRDDVWEHTLRVMDALQNILSVLSTEHNPDKSASWALGLISVRLGRYRQELRNHLVDSFAQGRKIIGLIYLAAAYHDVGKPGTFQMDEDGRIRFYNHQNFGSDIIKARAEQLRLSNDEAAYLSRIVRNHMRPFWLYQSGFDPSRRAVYRFFRDCGEAGVDICLISLADTMATYGPELTSDIWVGHLSVVRKLLEAWWEQSTEMVNPELLIKGDELIEYLDIAPGPLIGDLLKEIREAQATGEVTSREQALDFARSLIVGEGDENADSE